MKMCEGSMACGGGMCDESNKCHTSAASAGYSCWQLMTVKQIVSVNSIDGCIPVLILPKSLIGKTVKVTIEEQL